MQWYRHPNSDTLCTLSAALPPGTLVWNLSPTETKNFLMSSWDDFYRYVTIRKNFGKCIPNLMEINGRSHVLYLAH